MSEKIKEVNSWIIVVFCAIGYTVLMGFMTQFIHSSSIPYMYNGLFGLYPSTGLVGLTTVESINTFSSGVFTPGTEYWNHIISIALSFIGIFIFVPYLIIKGHIITHKKPGVKGIFWYAGTASTLVVIFIYTGALIVSAFVFTNTKSAQAESTFLDALRTELTSTAIIASQQMILPQEYGGGGGSFLGFIEDDNSMRSISLADLNIHTDLDAELFIEDDIKDSTIVLVAKAETQSRTGRIFAKEVTKEITLKVLIEPLADENTIRWLKIN